MRYHSAIKSLELPAAISLNLRSVVNERRHTAEYSRSHSRKDRAVVISLQTRGEEGISWARRGSPGRSESSAGQLRWRLCNRIQFLKEIKLYTKLSEFYCVKMMPQ